MNLRRDQSGSLLLFLDTSTPECRLTLVKNGQRHDVSWQANRELASGLLAFLVENLEKISASLTDITGIGVRRGPGSFTGLRIGLTVANTLAASLEIPIVGETGDEWRRRAETRLQNNENDTIALPLYGAEAHITTPRK